MKTIYQINKMALQVVVLLRSPTGLISLLLFATLFDGSSNALAISEVFQERMVNLVTAWDYSLSTKQAQAYSKIISTGFSLFASTALGLGILICAMQQPTKRDLSLRDDSDRGNMQTATLVLSWISFFMSFVGYMLFLSKGKTWHDLMSFHFIVQVSMAILLAGFVPYLFAKVSIHMRDEYGAMLDHSVNELQKETRDKFIDQIKGIGKKDTQKVLKKDISNKKRAKNIDLDKIIANLN